MTKNSCIKMSPNLQLAKMPTENEEIKEVIRSIYNEFLNNNVEQVIFKNVQFLYQEMMMSIK